MFDAELFKAAYISKGYTQEKLAEEIGMSLRTLNNKICGKQEFWASEVNTICKVLGIDVDGRMAIFFADEVSKADTDR